MQARYTEAKKKLSKVRSEFNKNYHNGYMCDFEILSDEDDGASHAEVKRQVNEFEAERIREEISLAHNGKLKTNKYRELKALEP
jgi:hypothetical protein